MGIALLGVPELEDATRGLGRYVRDRRNELGVNQSDLGASVGRDQGFISELERGVNLDRGIIGIDATRTRDAQGKWIIGDGPKTPSSERDIEIPELCVRVLREHRARQNAFRLKAPPGWWRDQDLVFPNRHGDVIASHTIEYRLTKLCELAKVPRLTPHELRHTGATWARAIGEDAEVLQRRLGHKKIETTLGTYSQERPGESRETSQRLERDLRRPG